MIETFLPEAQKLREYVSHYYILSTGDAHFQSKFTHYPNLGTTLNVYQNATVVFDGNLRKVIASNSNELVSVFTNNRDTVGHAEIKGKIICFGIVFKPLGFNAFIQQQLSKIAPNPVLLFNDHWSDIPEYFQNFFECEGAMQISLLDRFLLDRLHGFEVPLLQDCLASIIATNGSVEVGSLADTLQVNRRTLLRSFQKHVGCSISYYKQIVRFRVALNVYNEEHNIQGMTSLAYDAEYYDQSDFIQHFKSLSGGLPKHVLPALESMGASKMKWKFEDDK